MKENSFQPSEEPQEQHRGEGAQGILWRNLLSSISQLFFVRSSWNLVGISHSRISTSFVKETFLFNHQGILVNNIQVTLDKEHRRWNFFFFVNQSKTIIQEVYMRENSFLPSEEPQEQHQGEGILWRNLLSSISQLFIVRSSWNLVGISYSRFSTSFVKETFLFMHLVIHENNIQVTVDDKEHLSKKKFFFVNQS